MKIRVTLILFAAILFSLPGIAQVSIKDSSIFTTVIYGTYSYNFPGGDLAQRFGGVSNIGGGLMFKTKSNWLFGGEGNYMFGGTVHNQDDIIKNVATANGFIIDANGYLADVLFSERGFSVFGKFGKVIPTFGPNPNSGIVLMAGIGFLENKIRIQNPGNDAPQVYGDYRKGYDRLNSGFAVNGSLGYQIMSNTRLLNFYLGFEFTQAWTQGRRDIDFDTGVKDTKKYSSQWYGFRLNWMIPLYKRKPKDYYLY